MLYRKLKNGTHAVGLTVAPDNRFIAIASAFDAREGKALAKALNSVLELFFKTSGGHATIGLDGREVPRGATVKVRRLASKLKAK